MYPKLALINALLFGTLLTLQNTAGAAQCTAKTGAQANALLELYTSEGCSSCPPADAWLSKLSTAGIDTTRLIPLAFHVDYWDYIGWKDRFAKAAYSERQRKAASYNFSDTVYTPQVMLNGADFRGWHQSGKLTQALEKRINKPSTFAIQMLLNSNKGEPLKVNVQAQSQVATGTKLYIASYENKLKSQVRAGENNGRELTHDYVVRQLLGPYPISAASQLTQQFSLDKSSDTATGIVAFVQADNGEVIQALTLENCLQ